MFIWIVWGVIAVSVFMSLFWLNILQKEEVDVRSYPDPDEFPSISVLIPAYNEERIIADAIDSVLEQDYPRQLLDIIVVNDGSTDGTQEIVEEYEERGDVTLINQENQGKGGALNTGLEHATGDLISVQDADSVIEPDAFRKMVGHFQKSDVGGVIAGIKPLETDTVWKKLQRVEYLLGILYRRLMSAINTLYITPGALSLYRRDLVKEFGGFDEDNLTEDLEIALRLKKHGYNIEMTAPAITRTEFPQSFRDLMRQRVRWYRGLINNTLRYREMIFNREYGLFGTFQMPLHLVFPFVSMIGAFMVVYGIGETVFNSLLWLSSAGFTLYNPFAGYTPYRFLLAFNVKVYFPLIIGAILVGALIYLSHRYTDEKLKHPLSIGAFFIIYYTILGIFWCMAVGQEITRREKRW
ncbi:MAG: glycosyltransferase [Candidatus Nanohaloarchaea archaeon]|nr:glycosyltransferase [Candidatus Nanohaloarchaea archaeon]